MFLAIAGKLKELGRGVVLATVNVGIPVPKTSRGEVQNRVPDLVVAGHQPEGQFAAGDPPELAIEILSTPRGNVERTEKIDDYARAAIREYWVVNPFFCEIEVYILDGDSYRQMQQQQGESTYIYYRLVARRRQSRRLATDALRRLAASGLPRPQPR